MKNIKKLLFSILVISFFNIFLIEKFVYANPIAISQEIEVINYSPLYYIAVIVSITFVVGLSILILREFYKNNQIEKDKENKKGEEK